ncbi:MAG TPA: hypothetical protein VK643_14225 [Burkholderiales bacterium]|nr:hypothetical protein [Burkholderiales bacterium]
MTWTTIAPAVSAAFLSSLLAAIVAAVAPAVPIAAGIVLLAGCLGALVGNVMRAGKR